MLSVRHKYESGLLEAMGTRNIEALVSVSWASSECATEGGEDTENFTYLSWQETMI